MHIFFISNGYIQIILALNWRGFTVQSDRTHRQYGLPTVLLSNSWGRVEKGKNEKDMGDKDIALGNRRTGGQHREEQAIIP